MKKVDDQPLFITHFVNYLTWKRVTVQRFQSEKFIFTAQIKTQRYKLFQIVYGKSDGSLYVTFPYFHSQTGFLSTATFPGFITKGDINLEKSGKVTSNHVKYAHHPDGEVHFSQSGKIKTDIRRKSLPLKETSGHMFTIHVQDVSSFELDPVNEDHPAKLSKTTLNFKFDGEEPEAIKIIARWHNPKSFLNRTKITSPTVGPTIRTQAPNGKIHNAILIGPPAGFPLNEFMLLVTCEAIPKLEKESKSLLMFIGGFDPPNIMNNLIKPLSFLYMSYPAINYETLKSRLGSIDIVSK